MKRFTLRQAAAACGARYEGAEGLLDMPVRGVVIDHRKVEKGFLFIPIKGERFDGHDFIPAAYEAGALACISERAQEGDRPYMAVASSLQAYQDIAAFYKSLFSVKTFGITGSAGKTTTKEVLSDVLSQTFCVLKTEGNLNNQTGVPQTLLRLEETHEAAVIEMGTNHFGEIRSLARMVQPDFCFLTNIGTAHIEHLGSREGILRAKSEMLEYIRPGGRVFVNGDDDLLKGMKRRRSDVTTFGIAPENDVFAADICAQGLLGTAFTACCEGERIPVFIPSPGRHMVVNALAAVCAGMAMDMRPEDIAGGIAAYQPVGHRMQIRQVNGVTVINDAYNANPGAMKAAVDVLCMADGRKVCILGDMMELGDQAERMHREVGEYAAARGVDLLLCVGAFSRFMAEQAARSGARAVWFATQAELLKELERYLCAGDSVLVKASRGMRMEQTVERLFWENGD